MLLQEPTHQEGVRVPSALATMPQHLWFQAAPLLEPNVRLPAVSADKNDLHTDKGRDFSIFLSTLA